MAGYERRLLVASRTAREDAVSRYLLPMVEELATEKLMETGVRPAWLVQSGAGDDRRRRLLLHPRLALGGAGAAAAVDAARPGRAAAGDASPAAAQPVDAIAAPAVAGGGAGAAGARLVRISPRLGLGRDDGGAWRGRIRRGGPGRAAGPQPCRPASGISRAAPRSGWRFPLRSAAGGASIWDCVAFYAAASFFIAQHFRHSGRTRLTAR